MTSLDQQAGVTLMTDLNGNTLTLNSNGIIHSSGESILFTRDTGGRIVKITDPAGNILSYNTNTAGHLVGFTDREGNITPPNHRDARTILGAYSRGNHPK